MRELKGKVAVVTGAASGIGRAMAERFAREGMKLVLADVAGRPARRGARRDRSRRCRGHRRAHRRVQVGGGRRACEARVRGLRRGARPLQQRGRRRRRPVLGDAGGRLGVGPGRQPVERRPRHPRVRAPHDRAGRGPRRQHGIDRGSAQRAGDGPLLRDQARCRRHQRVPAPRPHDHRQRLEGARERRLPGLGEDEHRRRRAQPPRVGARRQGALSLRSR